MDKLLTYDEVAAALNVSRRTVVRKMPGWIADGLVTVFKIGRIYRVSEGSLSGLLKNLTVEKVEVA